MSKEFKFKLDNQFFAEEVIEETEEKDSTVKEGMESKKYTDEDLNNIIAKQKAKWEKDAEDKVNEAKKLAKMNADKK